MESDRAETNLGIAAEIEATEASTEKVDSLNDVTDVPGKPKPSGRRFVGRRPKPAGATEIEDSNALVGRSWTLFASSLRIQVQDTDQNAQGQWHPPVGLEP
jgi:hypothetical protein